MGNPCDVPCTVDHSIHRAVDEINRCPGYLKRQIKLQTDGNVDGPEQIVRCGRGGIVVTPGYGLCGRIIHTVGPKSDYMECRPKVCSSSLIQVLELCYHNIVMEFVRNREIKRVAIPVIGAGMYNIKFEEALKIAIAEIYNNLLDLKSGDKETFDYLPLEKIYIVVLDHDKAVRAQEILKEYTGVAKKDRRAVPRKSFVSQLEFLKEVRLYDKKRGYFSVAHSLRVLLSLIRIFLFFPSWIFKDWIGGIDWIRRREVVELQVFIKMTLPFLGLCVIDNCADKSVRLVIAVILCYEMLDTVTYLLSLIFLSDVQKPSANIIRSLLMLVLNYVEVSLTLAYMFYYIFPNVSEIKKAIDFGFFNNRDETIILSGWKEYLLVYSSEGVRFFFLTVAFGYLAGHLKQRNFRNGKNSM